MSQNDKINNTEKNENELEKINSPNPIINSKVSNNNKENKIKILDINTSNKINEKGKIIINTSNLFSSDKNTQNEQKIVNISNLDIDNDSINEHHRKEKSENNLMDLMSSDIKEEPLPIGFSRVNTIAENEELNKKKKKKEQIKKVLMVVIPVSIIFIITIIIFYNAFN